jgi:heptosyltransferase-1
MYPPEKFAQISNEINGNFIILWGRPSEKIISEKIKLLSPGVCIVNKLSLNKLKALISQVDLVIGPDTGPTHMAWALNVASITLFGPTPGYRNTYVTKVNKIIESKSKVDPFKINKNDFSIKDIDIQEIIQVSQDLLDQ